jgi:carboxyl-terminal processing protease
MKQFFYPETAARALLLLFLCITSVTAAPTPVALLDYKGEFSDIAEEVLIHLQQNHYRHVDIDDQLSSKLLDRYLKLLDPTRSHFLTRDIEEFETVRKLLDDGLRTGNVEPAFHIYNRFQQRLAERLTYSLDLLEKQPQTLDLTQDERLDLDREQAPWPRDSAAQQQLWRRQLKNSLITLRLADGHEDPAKANQVLIKRFHNQLSRLQQTGSRDVFQLYMDALTSNFDPHTQYFSPRLSENFQINMSLSLEGIGAVLSSEDEEIKIVRLVPKGPADKSGQLHSGDRIIAVGQGAEGELVDIVGWRLDDVVEKIRGKKGTQVRLKVIPHDRTEGGSKIVTIERNEVKLEEQAAQSKIFPVDQNGSQTRIGVITLPAFYADFEAQRRGDRNYKSTTRDVARLLGELKAAKVDGIVLDLRNNGGGSLQEVNSLIGLFIQQGPTVQVRLNNGRTELQGDPDPRIFYSGPLAVLVNRLSASASEIFAGAIQDYQRGLVIGEQTFGKGTVQSLIDLNEGQIKITTAKFYRISGQSTQNRGVTPDISFPSLVDTKEIGESALPDALPWDTIAATPFRIFEDHQRLLPLLRTNHAQRSDQNPEFIYLIRRAELQKRLRDQKELSLNEKTRDSEREKIERERLDLENQLRASRGEAPLSSVTQIARSEEKDELNPDPGKDPLIVESGHILVDYMALDKQQHLVRQDGSAQDRR